MEWIGPPDHKSNAYLSRETDIPGLLRGQCVEVTDNGGKYTPASILRFAFVVDVCIDRWHGIGMADSASFPRNAS